MKKEKENESKECLSEWRPNVEISINLLPQSHRHKATRSVYLIPILGIAAVLAAASFLTYSYFDTKHSIQTLSENITAQTTVRDQLLKEYGERTAGVTEFNVRDQYIVLDDFLNNIYKNTIDLQKRVHFLLPGKAEIMASTYSNNGELTMTISFYSKGDSAIFLHRLLNAPFVDSAEVESITIDDEKLTYESIFQIKLDTLVGEAK
jgi:hypothetical protein